MNVRLNIEYLIHMIKRGIFMVLHKIKEHVKFKGISVSLGIVNFEWELSPNKNSTSENSQVKEDHVEELVQLLKEISSVRKTLSYFYQYYHLKRDYLLLAMDDDEDEVENRLAFELSSNVQQRIYHMEKYGDKEPAMSLYCPDVFEVYEQFEKSITATNFFWKFKSSARYSHNSDTILTI